MTETPPDQQQTTSTATDDRVYHWIYLVLAALVLLLSSVLRVGDDGGSVIVPYLGYTLPEVCTFKRVVGVNCPGCGLTRAFISLAHGDIAAAWRYNPGSLLFFAIVVLQIPFRLIQVWLIRTGFSPWRPHLLTTTAIWCLLGLLVTQWVVRLILQYLSYDFT